MNSTNDSEGEMDDAEVDPQLRARMEALMQHYLTTDDNEEEGDDDNNNNTIENIDNQDKEEDGEEEEVDDDDEENPLPLPSALPPTLPLPSLDIQTTKTESNVKKSLPKKEIPPSAAIVKIIDLFGGHALVNKKDLEQIENNQIDITARMRQMSTQLRNQNEESQALYKEASEDLNEYISLLNNMKTMMHDIDSKLIDIKKRSAVSE